MSLSKSAQGYLYGILGVAMFSGTLPATRIALTAFDPAFITTGRAAVAGFVAASLLLAKGRPRPDGVLKLIGGAAMLVFAFPLFMALGLQTNEASRGAVVLGLMPLLTALIATFLTHQAQTLSFWLASVSGGALVIAFVLRGNAHGLSFSDGYLILASISGAAGYALSGEASKRLAGWEVICWQLVLMLPLTALLTVLQLLEPIHIDTASGSAFLYVSLISMLGAFFVWNKGLAMGGVAEVSQLLLFQVFFTIGISALIGGETTGPDVIVFATAIAACVFWSIRARK